jgi:hypothetical protein
MAVTIGNIKILEFDALLKDIDKFSERVQKRVDLEIQASMMTIVRDSKKNSAINQGRMRSLMTYVKHAPFEYEFISAANYTAYIEFGTKSLAMRGVIIPQGLESVVNELAAQFKGVSIDSGGVKLKDAIYEWARQKGIEEKWWYWIYKKIQTVGVKAHPAIIPALAELLRLQDRIRKILSTAS